MVFGAARFRGRLPNRTTLASSLFDPKGTILSLDDPLYGPRMATLGLYGPAVFLERAPMMFNALEEDVGYSTPVAFSHGIGGRPRDFAAIVA